jgi:7,8-dihydropterin-6-yl-methyl-4-(beta-D-ribofuranosyl)aminobenzene 5'-phosphate synthase
MMAGRSITLWITRLWAVFWAVGAQVALSLVGCGRTERASQSQPASQPSPKGQIVLTIVYDNNPGRDDMTPAWGFGCVVQGLDRTILFDTGGDGRLLLANMRAAGVDPNQIDAVFISHAHGDHTGGLGALLRSRGPLDVYLPGGAGSGLVRQVQDVGGRPVDCDESVQVCPGARTTGTLGRSAIPEHGLCVQTRDGWILITGCAHPGVGELAAAAKEVTGGDLALVVGGFHMGWQSERQILAVIERFENLGVRAVAPCHCTGQRARKLFKRHFAQRCTLAGVGNRFEFTAAPR